MFNNCWLVLNLGRREAKKDSAGHGVRVRGCARVCVCVCARLCACVASDVRLSLLFENSATWCTVLLSMSVIHVPLRRPSAQTDSSFCDRESTVPSIDCTQSVPSERPRSCPSLTCRAIASSSILPTTRSSPRRPSNDVNTLPIGADDVSCSTNMGKPANWAAANSPTERSDGCARVCLAGGWAIPLKMRLMLAESRTTSFWSRCFARNQMSKTSLQQNLSHEPPPPPTHPLPRSSHKRTFELA